MGSLRPLFHPQSVAVIGASREPGSVGFRILDALVRARFNGPVYPVNPKAGHIGSIRAYPSVEAIGRPVDLAVIAVPAKLVPNVVADCERVGVRALIVITAGFAEIGGEGVERQDELLAAVRRAGMRMVGPNCLGLLHTHADVRLNASFAPSMPPRGAVGLCSQSGALGVAIIALARRIDLGMSSFVSVGNKADISAIDLLEWWEQDETTDVLLFYLEAFGDPRHFAPVARRVGRRKPIVMVKAGRTEAGGRAASSHTAALAASETAVEALFRQTGILRAETLEEMFGLARALTQQPLPRGRRVAVVTNAGGPGILCVDALEGAGLEVPRLAPGTRATLNAFLPSAASSANPVDMIASAGPREFRAAVEVLLRAEEVDALVVLYTPAGMFVTESVAESVVAGVTAAREAGIDDKPVFVSVVGDEEETYAIRDDHETLPAYRFPEEIGRVLGKMVEYAEWRRADPGVFVTFGDQSLAEARAIVTGALDERGEGWLSLAEARRTLEAAGLTVAPGGVATSAKEAAAIAKEVGFPVAVKLASLQLVHKTEIGGVVLGLQDAEAVEAAYRGIEERLAGMGRADAMDGALVQPMLEGAAEVMIGVNQDPVFGPLIAFGLGGIHVEVLRDVAFRVAPLSDRDASAMVSEIRGHQLLQGYRGHAAADIAALEEALLRMSRLVEAVPEIREIDLNPIFALEPGHGYRIVDARIRVA
ncbi:MAG: acetate--CoA ligase family protein [Polyangiaceae bacterium]